MVAEDKNSMNSRLQASEVKNGSN